MREAYSLVWSVLVFLFRPRVSLEAEILILRHQLNIQPTFRTSIAQYLWGVAWVTGLVRWTVDGGRY